MNNSILQITLDAIKRYKYTKHLAVVSSALLFSMIIFFVFFSKGTLQVSTENGAGFVRVTVTKLKDGKLEDSFKPITLEGRSVSKKLSPGSYKVSSMLFENEANGAAKKAETFKEIKVNARETTTLNLKVFDTKKANLGSSTVEPIATGFKNEKLYLITEFGTVLFLNPLDGTKKVLNVNGEPLRGVLGFCGFNNGNAVAMDSSGLVYKVSDTTAEILEIPYQEGTLEELDFDTLINGTKSWICQDNMLTFIGLYDISSTFEVKDTVLADALDELSYGNIQNGNDGSLLFYDRIDLDSFDGAGGLGETEKDVTVLKKDSSRQEIKLGSFVSGLAGVYNSKLCYYYIRSISCVDFNSKQIGEVLKLPDNLSISNIAMLDVNKIIYSYSKSVWLLDLESGASSQIYESDHTIMPYSMSYDFGTKRLVFSGVKAASDQVPTSYITPLINFGESGL